MKGGQHGRVLAAQRARGNHDDTPLGDVEVAQDAIAGAGRRTCRRRPLQRVELQTAGDDDPRRHGADVDDAAGRFFALHAEAVDVGEHTAEEAARQPVARIRARRDAAVDDDGGDAAGTAFTQEIRPDLGLHHDEEPRPQPVEQPAHDRPEIDREVEDGVGLRHVLPGHLVPGHRGRGEEQLQPRIACPQGRHDGARDQDLAHRDGMNPDRRLAVGVDTGRQATEPVRQAAEVLAMAQRLPGEPR